MNNVHITPNSFSHGSRILKETSSLTQSGLVKNIYIVALHDEGLNEHEELDGNRVVWRIRLVSRKWGNNIFFKGIKYVEFCLRIVKYCLSKKIDIVNVHNLNLLPLGVFLKFICRAKLVYDAHELETETYGLRGLKQAVARSVERVLIKFADLVIVVGGEIERWYRDKYSISNIITALNCPEMQEVPRSRLLHDVLDIPKNKKIIIYQGGLIEGRGIEKLLDSFSQYKDDQHVLVFMGYGSLESLVRGYAESNSNIFLQEAVPSDVVLQYTASADVGVSYIDNPSLNDNLCLPNKLFEYIMAGLPVIVNNAPEMSKLVLENNIGLVLKELTSRSLSQALVELESFESEVLNNNLSRTAKLCSWNNQSNLMLDAYNKFIFE